MLSLLRIDRRERSRQPSPTRIPIPSPRRLPSTPKLRNITPSRSSSPSIASRSPNPQPFIPLHLLLQVLPPLHLLLQTRHSQFRRVRSIITIRILRGRMVLNADSLKRHRWRRGSCSSSSSSGGSGGSLRLLLRFLRLRR